MTNRQAKLAIVFSVLMITIPRAAYAYVDPGTGSWILQTVLAGILGISFALKTYWRKIKLFFKKNDK